YLFLLFIDFPPTLINTLSLHDALPIFGERDAFKSEKVVWMTAIVWSSQHAMLVVSGRDLPIQLWNSDTRRQLNVTESVSDLDFRDRKSTRLNSSHVEISYAVFCLKKKK